MTAVGAVVPRMDAYLPGGRIDVARAALIAALPVVVGAWPVVSYNDDPTTTHADIMALFDRAIESAS